MSLKFITDVKDDESWESVVIQAPSSTLCVIDVYTQWCGPCTALDHKLQQLHIELVNSEIKVRLRTDRSLRLLASGCTPRFSPF
eukprot:scaffold44093_cov31-Tisochrysis_lutea.AAC.1